MSGWSSEYEGNRPANTAMLRRAAGDNTKGAHVNVYGIHELVEALRHITDDRGFQKGCVAAVREATKIVYRAAKADVPVHTGNLKRGIRRKARWSRTQQRAVGTVLCKARHAHLIEYGHWTRGKKSFVEGQEFLTNALKANEGKVRIAIGQGLQTAIMKARI